MSTQKEVTFLFHFASISCNRFKMKQLFRFALIEGIFYFISFFVDGVDGTRSD